VPAQIHGDAVLSEAAYGRPAQGRETLRRAPCRSLTEGEAWTMEQLELLRHVRFSPAGVVRFLSASRRRAGEVRGRRPALRRQSRSWLAVGAAAWVLPAGAGAQPFRRHAPAGLAWWALVALMLDWHLGMVETEDGSPRPLGAADALTLARVWLAPVALACPTPLVCAAGFATDALDGPVARAGEPTRAGRDLEGLADACFAGGVLMGLRRSERLGRTASGAELLRLTFGFSYSVAVYFGRARPPDRHLTQAARLTTPMRAGGLIAAAAGRPRLGTALVGIGCAWSAALLGAALQDGASRTA